MIKAVELPLPLEEQMRDEAVRAYPRECCGLIEGVIAGEHSRVIALHPMPNMVQQPDGFEIDPSAHIALLRNLRGTGRDIIGCYHSHPNGRAEPSARDRESAQEEDFLWLITAIDAETQATSTAAFVRGPHGFSRAAVLHDTVATSGACGPT